MNSIISDKLLALGFNESLNFTKQESIYEQLLASGFQVFPSAKNFIDKYFGIQSGDKCTELKIPVGFILDPTFKAVEDFEGFDIVAKFLGENLCPIGNSFANSYKNFAVSETGVFFEFWDDLWLIGNNEEEFFETLLIDPCKNVKRIASLNEM